MKAQKAKDILTALTGIVKASVLIDLIEFIMQQEQENKELRMSLKTFVGIWKVNKIVKSEVGEGWIEEAEDLLKK